MTPDGLIVVDKPSGLTSHDVVRRVRRCLGMRRAGHGGTLDPDATGVLLVAVGQATRFFPFLSKSDKVYEGRIALGFETDTYDASGHPVTAPSTAFPDLEALAAAMKTFEGESLQTPPRFSAKKIAGRPVYKLARADEAFELEPVRVRVARFVLKGYRPPDVWFEAACSAGTYIRSLACDLGRKLGCGAHLAALRRTFAGAFGLADAVSLEAFEAAAAAGGAARFIRPVESLLPETAAVTVIPAAEAFVKHGRSLGPADLAVPLTGPGEAPFRLLSGDGRLLGLARRAPDGTLHPFLVLS